MVISIVLLALLAVATGTSDEHDVTQIDDRQQTCQGGSVVSPPVCAPRIVREIRYPLRICVTIIALVFLLFNFLWEIHRE